jgi:preflagellin peptidase FlaK
MYSIAALIVAYQLYTTGEYMTTIISVLISLVLVGGGSYILYKLNIFYGADYKALVGLSIMIPTYPNVDGIPLSDYSYFTSVDNLLSSTGSLGAFISELNVYVGTELFGFALFINTAILSIFFFVSNTVYNVRSGDFSITRPLRSMCARKIKKENVTEVYAKIIQDIDTNHPVKRGWIFITKGLSGLSTQFYKDYMDWYRGKKRNDPDTELSDIDSIELEKFINENENWDVDNLEEDREIAEYLVDRDSVWATPSIPFIVPIFLGVVCTIFFGNIAFILLQVLVG